MELNKKLLVVILSSIFLALTFCKDSVKNKTRINYNFKDNIYLIHDIELPDEVIQESKFIKENIIPLLKLFEDGVLERDVTKLEKADCFGLRFNEFREKLIRYNSKWNYLHDDKHFVKFKKDYALNKISTGFGLSYTQNALGFFSHPEIFTERKIKFYVFKDAITLFTNDTRIKLELEEPSEGIITSFLIEKRDGRYCFVGYRPDAE
jgi:hypothetical protein